MATLYVMQDGGDFYVYGSDTYEELLRVDTAPFRVPDWDLPAAQRARAWFMEQTADALVWR